MDVELIKDKTYHMRALYVEDDDEVRSQTAKILSLFFDTVIQSDNGYDGLQKIKEYKIDIVFTDINMPGISGLDMIQEIKKINPSVKFVIFSAYDDPKFFTKAIQMGVDGYILKPFLTSDVLEVLEKITRNKDDNGGNLIYLQNGFIWDKDSLNLLKDGYVVRLTKNEASLLKMLLSSKEMIASSYDIENLLFDDDICDNKRVRNIISRFNKKIGYKLIDNIYSQGYRIKWRY